MIFFCFFITMALDIHPLLPLYLWITSLIDYLITLISVNISSLSCDHNHTSSHKLEYDSLYCSIVLDTTPIFKTWECQICCLHVNFKSFSLILKEIMKLIQNLLILNVCEYTPLLHGNRSTGKEIRWDWRRHLLVIETRRISWDNVAVIDSDLTQFY